MNDLTNPTTWSESLGLAIGDLFGDTDQPTGEGIHRVLLNGTDGCLAFSAMDELPPPTDRPFRDWAWSIGVVHHVAVTPDVVIVQRWDDNREPRQYKARSVAQHLPEFYQVLGKERARASSTLGQHAVDVFRRLRSVCEGHSGLVDHSLALFLFLLGAM